MSTTEKPTVQLTGQDGNIFSIIGRVVRALEKAGLHAQAQEFQERVVETDSYDAALRLVMQYCDVR